ncbi:MAG: MFS transporter [Alphaproteobacteria bacterium]|jgi:16S rRNA (cytosine967-C5)-methyltransferase|nr:MFS transporter [Alphaproteobacteria bacterium]
MIQKTDTTSRKISLDILHAILNNEALAHELFTNDSPWGELSTRDRGFARLLVMSSIRHYGQLNICINSFLKKPPKPKLRTILLLGATQLLVLKTEPHAAIHTSVSLARQVTGDAYTGLVNAVLRKISQTGKTIFDTTNPIDNLPYDFRDDWVLNWGKVAVEQIMSLAQKQAPLDITLKHTSSQMISHWCKKLSAKPLSANSLRCTPVSDVAELPGYETGEWWVQDCAAAMPARLMGDVSGKDIIDLCAAPGGKTAQLISAGANVTAIDQSASRITRLDENLSRLCLDAEIICADGRLFEPLRLVDGVLLDAPCSATGTLRRRPDVLFGKTSKQISELQSLQIELALTAAKWIKAGGILIYATCSLQKQEGEDVIEALLSDSNSRLLIDPISEKEAGAFFTPTPQKTANHITNTTDYLRILPNQLISNKVDIDGNDGFFIARFKVK